MRFIPFTGEYEHTIDAKQRLAIPADIRSRLDSKVHGEGFYLGPGANGHLWIWPETTFEQLAASLDSTLLPAQELQRFESLMFSQSRRVELDKAGRIRLPEIMISRFRFGSSVMVLGVRDHLELWTPDDWTKELDEGLDQYTSILLRARESRLSRPARDSETT